MKLNENGWKLYNKWSGIHKKALQMEAIRVGGEDNQTEFGWCLLYDYGLANNADDEVGVLIYGYEDGAIDHVLEWFQDDEPFGGEWMDGVSAAGMVMRLLPYFDFDDGEEEEILARLVNLQKIR